MNNIKKYSRKKKRSYLKPIVECIKLDNEISMVMMSDPPPDPTGDIVPEHFSVNPFKFMN